VVLEKTRTAKRGAGSAAGGSTTTGSVSEAYAAARTGVVQAGRVPVDSVEQETLARVRRVLAGRADVVEKRMVGGVSFLQRGRMFCGVTTAGLMVRVGRAGREAALAEPHVHPMELGARRPRGFVVVDPAGYLTDELLTTWIERALDTVRALP
jgi:TfoX/Sxy family transcriptional regulator of competence genes